MSGSSKRVALGSRLRSETKALADELPAAAPEEIAAETTGDPHSATAELPEIVSPALPETKKPPLYQQMVRKDARIREEQLRRLDDLAYRLSRSKRGGPRLTENTLIRVALEYLLEKSEHLHGKTEEELLESLRRA